MHCWLRGEIPDISSTVSMTVWARCVKSLNVVPSNPCFNFLGACLLLASSCALKCWEIASSCSWVSVRPCRCNRDNNTSRCSEITCTSTVLFIPTLFFKIEKHWNLSTWSGRVEMTKRKYFGKLCIGSQSNRRPSFVSSSWSTESMKRVRGLSSDGQVVTADRNKSFKSLNSRGIDTSCLEYTRFSCSHRLANVLKTQLYIL